MVHVNLFTTVDFRFHAIIISGRISSVGRVLDCRAGGRGFDSQGRSNTQGLKPEDGYSLI